VPAAAYCEAAYRIRDARFWSAWALHALLALGAGHLLAGIMFFFAFNWADMSTFAKFAVVQGAIAGAALGALAAGLNRPAGQVLLIAASVLTGVALAVFGQIYQTGADAYELFVSWALLIAPWTLISRNAVHWLVWLTVACFALALYCEQILVPLDLLEDFEINLILGTVLLVALAARELTVWVGFAWLGASWTRYTLVFAALCGFFVPALTYLFEIDGTLVSAVLFVAVAAALFVLYRQVLSDFGGFALPTGFAAFFAMALGGRLIAEVIGFEEQDFTILPALALLTAWCVAVTVGLAHALTWLRRRHKAAAA